jgi:hypothetical protein
MRGFPRALAFGLAVAAITPAAAWAHFEDGGTGQQPQTEIPYLSWGAAITRPAPAMEHGGVTPTNLARAYVAPPVEASSASGSRFDTADLFPGVTVGVALALAAALALTAVRRGPRTAQS